MQESVSDTTELALPVSDSFSLPRSASEVLAAVPPPVARLQSPDVAGPESEAPKMVEEPPSEGRRLVRRNGQKVEGSGQQAQRSGMFDDFATDQLTTLGSALAVVLGLMLICVWIMKRAVPKGVGLAPSDVARVIGRVPLAAKQQAQLVYLGNKILFVSVTQSGSEKLGEIDDPNEVQRIVALCGQKDSTSAKAAFDDVFRSFDKERVSGFLDDEKSGGKR